MRAAKSVALATATTSTQMFSGAGILIGWSFRETTAAAGAIFELYDGTSSGGNLITTISLVANESTRDLLSLAGLELLNGLRCTIVSGTIKGAAWIIPADMHGNLEGLWRQ